MFSSILLFALQIIAVAAHQNTVTFNWNVDWVTAAPDGFSRPFVGINGQWPCPPMNVNIGDRVVVNVKNNLKNETTSIHFHGIFQKGSNQMDGPAMVSQCPIPPGGSFTYDFMIDQPGTYWYHSHVGGQYIDGFRGPLLVHDPAAPYASKIDEEVTLTVSDLYHKQAPYLINYFQSPLNEDLHGGSEPVPNATLINEAQNVHFPIKPNRAYLFRIINMGAFAAQYIQFDQHDMTVVEIDGVYTKPFKVQQLFIPVAQRYSVIVNSKNNAKKNFAIVASMNEGMFDDGVIPPGLNNNVTAWLVYDETKPLPPPFDMTYLPFDDTVFVPDDKMPSLGPVTLPITFNANFGPNDQDQNRGSFNNISYVSQKVPTLYTALSAPASLVNNPKIYGVNSNPYVLPFGAVVELTIINFDGGAHPFHLHSHNFQVIARSGPGPDDGPPLLPPSNIPVPKSPMRRDTVLIYGSGYAVIRFKVDNPGITLFHCHIEWHVEAGLTATFIEAPTQLQGLNLVIPQNHKDVCKKQGISIQGNAAGHGDVRGEKGWLDLSGANTEPPLQNWGALVNPPRARRAVRRTTPLMMG